MGILFTTSSSTTITPASASGSGGVKGEYEFNPCDAFGIEAAIPEHGSTGVLPTFLGGFEEIPFRPITQGDFFWTHTFCNDATVTGKLGLAERPGNFVFGADSRVPLNQNIALTGNFSYIMPNVAAGAIGQTQEVWNVSLGMEFVLGGFRHCCCDRFRPFIPVADNGTFAIRETD